MRAGAVGRVALPAAIRDALVAHAAAESPNEMCGFIIGTAPPADGGLALRWEPARNAAASPLRFDVAPEDLIRVFLEVDDRGEAVWAVVHSHVRSAAVPSTTDIAEAAHPDALHVLVSLATDDAVRLDIGPADSATLRTGDATPAASADDASVRAWRIVGGVAVEVALEIVE